MRLATQFVLLLQVFFRSILSLFYPQYCCVCNKKLIDEEQYVCLDCLLKMPKTNYHFQPDNNASDRFHGKFPYEKVASFLYYNKGGWAQKVVVEIKYRGNIDLGRYMGELIAKEIQSSSFFDGIDLIVPIPLHRKRLRQRGFNQAEEIAKGVSRITGIAVCSNWVRRKKQNQTQTKKGRYARWLNTKEIFTSEKKENITHKHVLIVDDVLTTGATVEACTLSILQSYPDIKISVLTLAVTE